MVKIFDILRKKTNEEASEIAKKVSSAETAQADMARRMDDDFELWNLKGKYESSTNTYKGTFKDDIEITSPDLGNFADFTQSRLCAADMQVIIRLLEKGDSDLEEEIAKLERLHNFGFQMADQLLMDKIMPPLLDTVIWDGEVRGWMCGRFLVYEDEDTIKFDYLPLDRRWLTYQVGAKGVLWVASKTFRSKAQIKDQYDGFDKVKGDKNNPVIDHWERLENGQFRNQVIINDHFARKEEDWDIPKMPILILPITKRPQRTSANAQSHEASFGDSIFARARHIEEVKNKMLSIWATHANLKSKLPVVNYMDEQGVEIKSTTQHAGGVINLPMAHNKLDKIPLEEISPTLINLYGILHAMYQRSTIPDIMYGELRDIPISGVGMQELKEASDKAMGPLIRTLNNFYTSACRLVEQQLLQGKLKVKVESESEKTYISQDVMPKDLQRAHITRVVFTARTPWEQVETWNLAKMARELGVPLEFIWEYIAKLPDPKGLSESAALEIAEHSPKVLKLKAIEAFLKRGERAKAEALIKELYAEEVQSQQGEQQAMPEVTAA